MNQSKACSRHWKVLASRASLLLPLALLTSGQCFGGFEIGNATITNKEGGYQFKVFGNWGTDKVGKFTDVISKFRGEKNKPRFRVDVIPLSSVIDTSEERWHTIEVAGKPALIRENRSDITGVYQAEVRINHSPEEVIVIYLDAQFDPSPNSGYSKLREVLNSFELTR